MGCVRHPSKTPEINGAVGRCPSKNFWNQEGAGQATQQGTGSGLGLKPVPAGARPMRRTSTSPPSPSRISEADFTGTPSETGDLTRVVSEVIGAERLHSWGVWSCTRAGTPLPAPPSRGMRV